ncbi:hyaluronan metabolic process [Homalodisca vitripennis]|nr:hyaluronan metabolic process [Homalodisca vitripennis]
MCLAKHNIPVLDHPLYSPNLATCDLFLKVKSALKGTRFEIFFEAVKEKAMEVMDRNKYGSQTKLVKRWEEESRDQPYYNQPYCICSSEAQPIDDLSASLYGVESSEEEMEDESRGDAKDKKLKRKKKARGTLERLWAYLTIQQLLDRRHVLETEDVKKRVVELALRYNFVTPMTSLVVVKPNQSVEIDQESLRPQSLLNRLYPNNNMNQNTHPSPTRVKYEGTSSFMEESTTNKLYTMERLQNLTLEDLTWLEGLVDWENGAVTLPLGVNGTNQQYRLGIDQDFGESGNERGGSDVKVRDVRLRGSSPLSAVPGSIEDQPLGDCTSPRGKMGQCRHLPHCVLPDILSSVTNYIRYYCPLPSGFAGICCPDLHHVTTTERVETTTGDTSFTTTEPIDTTESLS